MRAADSQLHVERKRWVVEEVDGFSHTRVFTVHRQGQQRFMAKDVWYSNGRVKCCGCSGPLQAMLSTCAHARAVARHIHKEPA